MKDSYNIQHQFLINNIFEILLVFANTQNIIQANILHVHTYQNLSWPSLTLQHLAWHQNWDKALLFLAISWTDEINKSLNNNLKNYSRFKLTIYMYSKSGKHSISGYVANINVNWSEATAGSCLLPYTLTLWMWSPFDHNIRAR